VILFTHLSSWKQKRETYKKRSIKAFGMMKIRAALFGGLLLLHLPRSILSTSSGLHWSSAGGCFAAIVVLLVDRSKRLLPPWLVGWVDALPPELLCCRPLHLWCCSFV
jgi:ABC-type nitrate/sulfonate/bicarbonate transport system permease component